MNTIVVVKLRAIGDAIIATPALRALREAYPSATMIGVTTPSAAPIWAHHPALDRVLTYHKTFPRWMASAWHVVGAVRQMRPDLVVNLHASSHSAWLSRAMGAQALVVHNHSGPNFYSTIPISALKESKSAIERDLDAVRALGLLPVSADPDVKLDPRDLIEAEKFFQRHQIMPERHRVMAIHPGASRATKRWPVERFAAAARVLLEDPDAVVLVLGGPGEEVLAGELQKMIGPRAVTATGRSLLEIGALMWRSRVLIGNDVGTHHLAAALRVPSVTMFGPELPREWHPYEAPRHIAVSHRVHCVNCGLAQCDRLECLRYVSVEEVVAAARRALGIPENRDLIGDGPRTNVRGTWSA